MGQGRGWERALHASTSVTRRLRRIRARDGAHLLRSHDHHGATVACGRLSSGPTATIPARNRAPFSVKMWERLATEMTYER
jgi:hypothetical protein